MSNLLYCFAGVTNSALDITTITLFMVASVVVVFATVYLISKFIYRPKLSEAVQKDDKQDDKKNIETKDKSKVFNSTGLLFSILGLGFVVRIIFVFTIRGDRTSINDITSMMSQILNLGFGSYYNSDTYKLYPLIAYLYSFIGLFARVFSITESSVMMPFFVKFPLVLSDLALATVLYIASKRYVNELVGLVIAGFVCLFPAFIFASSIWGSYFSIAAFLVVLCFYFISNRNYLGIVGSYSLLLLTVKEALYLYPIVAIFIIYSYVKLCSRFVKEEAVESIIQHKEYKNIILLPIYFIASMILMYLVSLPFIISTNPNFFAWMAMQYFKPLANFETFGTNALNIFNLFLRNGVELSIDFPYVVFAVMFSIIVIALVALVYLSRKNRANLSFLAVYIILTLSIFFMGFGTMNIFIVFGLMLLSFVLIKDKRILHVFSLTSLSALLNAFAVMAVRGHLNNLSDYELSVASYSGVNLLESGGALAISIICSVVMIATFIYATVVLLDLSMSNRRILFKNVANVGFLESLKNWFVK